MLKGAAIDVLDLNTSAPIFANNYTYNLNQKRKQKEEVGGKGTAKVKNKEWKDEPVIFGPNLLHGTKKAEK